MGRGHLAAVARYRMVVWIESGLAKDRKGRTPPAGCGGWLPIWCQAALGPEPLWESSPESCPCSKQMEGCLHSTQWGSLGGFDSLERLVHSSVTADMSDLSRLQRRSRNQSA